MGELPTEGDPAQKGGGGGVGGTCTERGRETCTERERGNYPQRGILHKRGGGGRSAQREGDLHRERERERELPTEGDPAQRGGWIDLHRERETCTERDLHTEPTERGNYPLRGILHTEGSDRGRKTCTQERKGQVPTEGEPAHRGGFTEGPARKKEGRLPTEGEPAQTRGRQPCTESAGSLQTKEETHLSNKGNETPAQKRAGKT